MNYPRLSLLFAFSLTLVMAIEAFSSSGPVPSGNPTLLLVQGRVLWSIDPERSQLWLAHKGALEVYDTTGERLARLVTPDIRLVRALDYDAGLDEVRVATDAAVLRFVLLAQFDSDGGASRVIRRQS